MLRGASDDDDEGISAEGFFGNDDDMAAVPRVLPSAVGTVGRGAGIAFPNGTALSWLAMLGCVRLVCRSFFGFGRFDAPRSYCCELGNRKSAMWI